LGSEYYSEDTHENEWLTNALDRGFVAGIPERKIRDRDYTTDTLSVFGQMDLAVDPLFRPTLGFRYDNFSQNGDNNANPLDTMPNYDEDNHVLTPKLGVRSAVSDHWELRASYAEGFALPSIDQRGLGEIDPVKFKQQEIGINGTPTRETYLDLAYFMLNSSDEIQLNPTTAQFENVGKTERSGVEGEIHYLPEALQYVDLSATFGFYDTEIKENIANPTLEGNKITKVPEHVANLTAAYDPPQGFGARLRWRTVGKMYVSNDNVGTYDGYDVIDLSLFYTMPGQDGHSTRFYIDGNNLTDEAYANGPGGQNGVDHPVTYNPMPPANVMLGVILKM
jgi:outer membrane receptor protein involved in Fe transport